MFSLERVMPVISFMNSKGGVGKTTVSIHVSAELHKRGYRVLHIDSDPQGTSQDWASVTDGSYFSVVGISNENITKDVERMSKDYDWIVIDGAAKLEKLIVSTLKASDLVIIPIAPSGPDIWGTRDLVDLIKTRQEVTDGLPAAAFLINQVNRRTILASEVEEVIGEMALPAFKSELSIKTAYARGITIGKTGSDINKSARLEVEALTDEIEEAFQ
tara:strand:+ start:587 stop:1234 length:648 start_codon:yes stop_codon:yes gene_type:complete